MFGYATDETEECMPLTVVLAHQESGHTNLRPCKNVLWGGGGGRHLHFRQIFCFPLTINVKFWKIVIFYYYVDSVT